MKHVYVVGGCEEELKGRYDVIDPMSNIELECISVNYIQTMHCLGI